MEVLGRYELRAVLGEGGFGTVYHAWDPALGRSVALKALHAHLAADAELRRRFLSEARAIAPLRHPNIATVYDVGEADGRPFFTMELIDGSTLSAVLAGAGRLPLDQVVRILRDLGDAVDYVHAAGLVHRDIKASNVMCESTGRVVLMDFGVVRVVEGTPHTNVNVLLGTPEVMAPEQIRGHTVGPAADIYALGLLAYQLLAGHLPFSGDLSYLLFAHAYEPPPPLATVRADLTAGVHRVVAAALAKEPSARPASARELADALAAASIVPVDLPSHRSAADRLGSSSLLPPRPTAATLPPTREYRRPATTQVETQAPAPEPIPALERRARVPLMLMVVAALGILGAGGSALAVARGWGGERAPTTQAPSAVMQVSVTDTPTTVAPTPTSAPPTPPVIAELKVYDDVVSSIEASFPERDNVAVCFSVKGTVTLPLQVVVTSGPESPREAATAGEIARVGVESGVSCHAVHAANGRFTAGAYRVWVLHGADVLVDGRFSVLAVPTPEPTAEPVPSIVRPTTPRPPTPTRTPTVPPFTQIVPPTQTFTPTPQPETPTVPPTPSPTVTPTPTPLPTPTPTPSPIRTPPPPRPP